MPAVAFAHPLGNFTINHYAGIRVEVDRILLDVVIDQAEIPTFQARLTLDTDGDGELSDAETETARIAACGALAPSLTLTEGATPLALEATDAGLQFPAGVGGLSTMRTVCEFRATLPSAITAASALFAFEDRSFPDRIGWREIVVAGSGATVAAPAANKLRTEGVSNRLTHYPANLLTQSLADTHVQFTATPGGPVIAPYTAPDAQPLPGIRGRSLPRPRNRPRRGQGRPRQLLSSRRRPRPPARRQPQRKASGPSPAASRAATSQRSSERQT